MTAVEKLKARAQDQWDQGHVGLANLFWENAEKGEAHAARYLEMMRVVGNAARTVRAKMGF